MNGSRQAGTILPLGVFAGFATGIVAGFVLQMVLGLLVQWLAPESDIEGWDTGAVIIVVAAAVVLVVPALRRAGSGLVLGLALGAAAQLALLVWLLSRFG